MIAVIVSAEAASLRPRGRSPAPTARDTVAEAAMVRPMLIDMAKKVASPTYPTAALNAWSPSRDTQKSDRRSTANTAMSPIAPVAVITATWRISEPCVNTGRALSRAARGAFKRSRPFPRGTEVIEVGFNRRQRVRPRRRRAIS